MSLLVTLLPLSAAQAVQTTGPIDTESYAQPDKVRVTALDLDLTVSFEQRELAGTATLHLQWRDASAHELILDTRGLKIAKIEAADASGHFKPVADFSLAAPDAKLGAALTVPLATQSKEVRIRYVTSPGAEGLQWLTPQQTAGKKWPFMYTQSESIAARDWVPLQDTPCVRFTYTAHIHTPKALRAAMSANNDAHHALNGDFRFVMSQKIPSYLLALAIGDISAHPIGPRSAVYAEPETLAAAASEFADVETMIKTAESLYGPYRWGRYDILVLPPSFPLGGMENPRLTFATPTIITGDKSLVSVIAHELAHSWSGNLVTMSSWPHIWLNEGFTTYVQGRIVEAVYGKTQADEEVLVDTTALLKDIKARPDSDQPLVSTHGSPYVKGSWFLRTLESKFGREPFDAFLRGYFDHFAFQSINSEQFADYLKAKLLDKYPGRFSEAEVHAWLYEPGLPADAPLPVSSRFAEIDQLRAQFCAGKIDAAALKAEDWRVAEWQYFLDQLMPGIGLDQAQKLDATYHLSGTRNATIAVRWYRLAIASGDTAAYPAMREHLLHIGRMILVVPLYQELVKTPEGLQLAEAIYAEAEPAYHAYTRGAVEHTLAQAKSGTAAQ